MDARIRAADVIVVGVAPARAARRRPARPRPARRAPVLAAPAPVDARDGRARRGRGVRVPRRRDLGVALVVDAGGAGAGRRSIPTARPDRRQPRGERAEVRDDDASTVGVATVGDRVAIARRRRRPRHRARPTSPRVFERLYTSRDGAGPHRRHRPRPRHRARARAGDGRRRAASSRIDAGGTRFVVTLPLRQPSAGRADDGALGASRASQRQLDRRRRFDLAAHVAERAGAAARAGATLVSVPTTLPSTHDLGADRRPVALDVGEPAQEPVHVAAAVDAAHELLAEEAALGERHRVALEERLLRDRRVVDVDALARDRPPRCAHASYAAGVDDRAVAIRGRARRSRRARRRRRPARRPVDRACDDRRARRRRRSRSTRRGRRDSMPELAGAVVDLGLHPDLEPVRATPRAARRSRARSRATHSSPTAQQRGSRRRACPAAASSSDCAPRRRRRPGRGPATPGLQERRTRRDRSTTHEAAVGAVDQAPVAQRSELVGCVMTLPVAERRERARAAAAREQRLRLVAAFQVLVGGDRVGDDPGAGLHAGAGRRARPSCGSRSRCRGCPRSRRSRRRPRTGRASSARARR